MKKRDHCIWASHCDPVLQAVIHKLVPGQKLHLLVNGSPTVWARMNDGTNGQPTFGIKIVDGKPVWQSIPMSKTFEIGMLPSTDSGSEPKTITSSDSLAKSVEKFIEMKYRQSRDKKTAASLLGSTTANRNSYAFLQQNSIQHLAGKPVTSKEVIGQIPMAIKDSVTSYTRKKTSAISIYNKYLDFLKKEYEINVDITFPPVFNNDFDRQMYIIKILHQRRFSAAEIGEELWLSERTITKDLAALEDGISILDQELKLKREENIYGNHEKNTIHPVFLSANLTQIVVMLRGLENQSKDKAYQEYAVRLAANIWGELSDYGRQRIIDVSQQLGLNTQWFDLLEEKRNQRLYSSESGCSYDEGAGNIINFLKNGKRCTLEIIREGKSQIIKDCLIKAYSGDEIKILHEENELQIPLNSVIRVTRFSKEIF